MPLIRLLGGAISTVEVGRAMIAAALRKSIKPVLDTREINQLARKVR